MAVGKRRYPQPWPWVHFFAEAGRGRTARFICQKASASCGSSVISSPYGGVGKLCGVGLRLTQRVLISPNSIRLAVVALNQIYKADQFRMMRRSFGAIVGMQSITMWALDSLGLEQNAIPVLKIVFFSAGRAQLMSHFELTRAMFACGKLVTPVKSGLKHPKKQYQPTCLARMHSLFCDGTLACRAVAWMRLAVPPEDTGL